MSDQVQSTDISFTPVDNQRLLNLCGPCNSHLQQIENHYGVEIHQRSHLFHITGYEKAISLTQQLLEKLYQSTKTGKELTNNNIEQLFQQYPLKKTIEKQNMVTTAIHTRSKKIEPRNKNQQTYVDNIRHHPINFSIGPAGTGKTYLAVACAVEALEKGQVQRLIFVRPAVEAGEKLGFLPGDLEDKVSPYLRPLYDALYEMLDFERVQKLIDRGVIEIAPLAFMRGRTLNDAFIILDEAQNTTDAQMKMFLTRIGFSSNAVITGDITQIDLPNGVTSGLKHAVTVVKDIDKIKFNYFSADDVVRHPLVMAIIRAYAKTDSDQ